MLQLPEKLRKQFDDKFKFTRVITSEETALFLPYEEGRFFICIPPPSRAGLNLTLLNKSLNSPAELIVLFLGVDTSTEWFHKLWREYLSNRNRVDIEFINGRIKWEEPSGAKSRFTYRIPGMLAIITRNTNS